MCEQESALLVADEIGTQLVEVDKTDKVPVETKHAGGAEFQVWLWATRKDERCTATVRQPIPKMKGIRLVSKVQCGDLEIAFFTRGVYVPSLIAPAATTRLPGLSPSDRLLARALVHVTQDSGRGFWKKFRRTLIGGCVVL